MKARTILLLGVLYTDLSPQLREKLRIHYGCRSAVAWESGFFHNFLHITARPVQEVTLVRDVEYINIHDALRELRP